MKKKQIVCAVLAGALMLCASSAFAGGRKEKEADPLSIADASVTELVVTVDGKEMKVTVYEDCYVSRPTSVSMTPEADGIDQKISIYVPEGAGRNSPIIFYVNNGGWLQNAYSWRRQVADGGEYSSTSDTDEIGKALKEGYVIASYGCRSRNDNPNAQGEYISHSPATVVDTKAAIRYLRYNQAALPAGNTDRIVITGTSGGGALSAIIAASGNSADFFEGLYEIGAAGISQGRNGRYTSSIRDDVFATIAYCPINDLRMASEAYEWTYQDARQRLVDEGREDAFQDPLTASYTASDMMAASKELAAAYAEYVDGLGLKTEDGSSLTSSSLEAAMTSLINAALATASERFGQEKMLDDLAGNAFYFGQHVVQAYNSASADWRDFLAFDERGSASLSDLRQYLYFVARNQPLKVAPAFSNVGLGCAQQNEDSLYGSKEHPYCPFTAYSWNNDASANGYGLDETGLTWDEFLQTDEGKALEMQLKMSSPIPYLADGKDGVAPYWYVRHGLRDRDTSFALQTVLYHAIRGNSAVRDINFLFTWLQPHSGDYDVQEAYTWLEDVLVDFDH